MTEGIQRRLAAILAADVAGYSSLMGEDEAGTLSALRQLRTELFAPTVDDHGGKVVKSMGDGWLVEFASVVDAVTCAIAIQEGLAGHDGIKLRMGVHLGDITHEEEDIFGDGVNIAARLQELAQRGGIVISDTTRRSIDGKLAAAFVDLGVQDLKNIAEPIIAYGWGMTAIRADAAALPLPEKPSIAVLPFANMSADPEQEYFSDGVTEDLTTALSRFDSLFVIGRNSAFAYNGKSVDTKRIGRELGVRYVLEGSVRRVDNRVRVNAQLVDAVSDRHVWAERYDRRIDDIFELQDDIVASIAATVGPEIALAETERARGKRPDNFDVWDLYLQSLAGFHRMTQDDIATAVSLLENAIKIEPDFAKAHALLGMCHAETGMRGWVKPVSKAYEAAAHFAETGVRLAPSSPETNYALGFVLNVSGNPEQAVSALRRALDLNPNYAEAYAILGQALNFCGDQEAGLVACRKAERGSPRNPRGSYLYDAMGHIYFMLGDYEQAIEASKKALHQDRSTYGAYVTLAGSYALLGRPEEALRNVDALLRMIPRYNLRALRKNPFFIQPEQIDKLVESMRLAGLPE